MVNTDLKDTFLQLVRLGIGNDRVAALPSQIDWNVVEALAKKQGLHGVVYDGVGHLHEEIRPQITTWLRWIGEVVQGYEQRFSIYKKAVVDLGNFYHNHGYRMLLLKGLDCGVNWPKPEHRPYGDIDVYLFGKQKEADEVLARELGIKIDNSHHHHTVFPWYGFTVENHYDFLNIDHHNSNIEIENMLKGLVEQSCDKMHIISVSEPQTHVYLPSANFTAFFLLRHMMNHFASVGMCLRQLLDWGFYAKAHGSEIDWNWLETTIEHFGMRKMYDVFNAICVSDLGFDVKTFPRVQFDPFLKERVLNDILSPEFSEPTPKWLIRRIPFKYRRWKANEWKHELCYTDSMKSAFWSGVKSHLMKPSSI